MSFTGRCLCGSVAYEVRGKWQMSLICHCKNCQRQAGSAFSTLLGVARADFALTGQAPRRYVDTDTTTGNPVDRYFCASCGSPIYSALDAYPDAVFIKVGTLDDTSGYAPAMHIWCDSKQQWFTVPDDVPQVATQLDAA